VGRLTGDDRVHSHCIDKGGQTLKEARANRNPAFFFGLGFGSDVNGLHGQPVPRPNAASNPVQYPFTSFDGGSVIDRQQSGTRVYDLNTDGVDHYGLYPDWIEDLRLVAGPEIVDDLANGAEAYLQLSERAEAAASPRRSVSARSRRRSAPA
jgi:hypothetical protein